MNSLKLSLLITIIAFAFVGTLIYRNNSITLPFSEDNIANITPAPSVMNLSEPTSPPSVSIYETQVPQAKNNPCSSSENFQYNEAGRAWNCVSKETGSQIACFPKEDSRLHIDISSPTGWWCQLSFNVKTGVCPEEGNCDWVPDSYTYGDRSSSQTSSVIYTCSRGNSNDCRRDK